MKKSSLFALLLATAIVAGSSFKVSKFSEPVIGKDSLGQPHDYDPNGDRVCIAAPQHCLFDASGNPVDKEGQPSSALDGAYEIPQ